METMPDDKNKYVAELSCMSAKIFLNDLIKAHSIWNKYHSQSQIPELRMTSSILSVLRVYSAPPISARPVLQHAPGSSEHCRGRSLLLLRPELARVCLSSRRHGRSGFSPTGHFRLSLGRTRLRGSPAGRGTASAGP